MSNPTLAYNPLTGLFDLTAQTGGSFPGTIVAACSVATTGTNLTATYSNGASGVGATLTNSGTKAALTIDGVALSSNNRVLVKDQTTTYQNGVYYVSVVGNGSTNWVLVRSSDYDSPSQIVEGSLVPISAGTINANTIWIESQVVTTIGTDPIEYDQFSSAPIQTTQYAVLVGGDENTVDSLPVADDNTVLAGNTGANPGFTSTPTVTSMTLLNAPVAGTDATNKAYVDAIASGLNFIAPVLVATTATLNAIYTNGASGVGATLVNAGSLAAFSVDGQTPAINSRVLVKNQTNQYENGIYYLSTTGSGAVAWILTRTTDYDSASEIYPGNLVPVTTGSVNANTIWLQVDTVATIGTDAIQFSLFNAATRILYNITITSASTYNITSTDEVILVDTTNYGAVTVNLPASPGTGLAYQIKDYTGNAVSNPITVVPVAGDIDGADEFTINADYRSCTSDIFWHFLVRILTKDFHGLSRFL